MPYDRLVSVADAAHAPSRRMSDMFWPGNVCRRANQTDYPHPAHTLLAVVTPARSPPPAELLEVSIWEWSNV